eukprot:7145663-Prymnesium_polylepis.1
MCAVVHPVHDRVPSSSHHFHWQCQGGTGWPHAFHVRQRAGLPARIAQAEWQWDGESVAVSAAVNTLQPRAIEWTRWCCPGRARLWQR